MSLEGRPLAPGILDVQRLEDHPVAKALEFMAEALALLDAAGAPADAGAYLDLAMHRLREWLGDGAQITVASTGTVLK